MNERQLICIDFETGGRNPDDCEILQIAACHIDARRLVIGDTFVSYCKPTRPELIEDGALKVNKIKREDLDTFPAIEFVWKDLTNFVQKWNPKKNSFNAPIMCGYNIRNFDLPILKRYCDKYGPSKDGKQQLVNDFYQVDLYDFIWHWGENSTDLENYKLDTIRSWLGMSTDNAHDALQDVKDTGSILIRFLNMYRNQYHKIPFKNAFRNIYEKAV